MCSCLSHRFLCIHMHFSLSLIFPGLNPIFLSISWFLSQYQQQMQKQQPYVNYLASSDKYISFNPYNRLLILHITIDIHISLSSFYVSLIVVLIIWLKPKSYRFGHPSASGNYDLVSQFFELILLCTELIFWFADLNILMNQFSVAI